MMAVRWSALILAAMTPEAWADTAPDLELGAYLSSECTTCHHREGRDRAFRQSSGGSRRNRGRNARL